eukprot:8107710-Pyramimonas_sp.AAC.1
MTTVGTDYLGAVISGDYTLIWVGTPGDWYVRTPGNRVAPHWSRIQNLLAKAKKLRMTITACGPPGYVWKFSPIRDTLEDLKLTMVRMRLCHFGIRFNMQDNTPSGTYMEVATSIPISSKLWA